MTGRSGLTNRTLLLSVRSPDGGHVSPAFNSERLISTVDMLTGCSDKADRTLDPQRPVIYSKGPKHVFDDRTRPVMLDRTLPAFGQKMSPLCALHQRTSTLTGRTLPASGRKATQHPVV